MKQTNKTWQVIAAVSAAVAASANAIAAEQTDVLEEIVVTAQFREQKLQDTPIAITAVNAALLEVRGQTNIAQIAAQAPNVSLRPQPQNGGSGLIAFIRGVGQTDFNYALDPGVGVYIDDVYIPTLSSSLLELIDLDRIEILRGPQGTLAGKNAIGGAIKLFSQKPKGDDSGSVRLSYGSYNEITARAMADFKLSDTVAVRFSGMNRSSDGYVAMLDYSQTHPNSNVAQTNTRGNGNSDYQTMGGQNITAARAALRFTPTDQLEVNLSTDYTRERSEAIPTVLIAAGATVANSRDFNPNTTGKAYSVNLFGAPLVPLLVGKNGQPIPYDCRFVPAGPYSCDTGANLKGWNKRFVSYSNFLDGMQATPQAPYKPYFSVPTTEFYGHGFQGTLNYKLNDNAELVYIGSYRKYTSKFGQDQDASPLPLSQLDNQLNHHAFTSELRLNLKSEGGFAEGTVGAFYLKQKGIYTARVDLNYVGPTIDFLHGPDPTPSNTKAVFATATLHPLDALSLTGGLRYTKDQKDYTWFRSNPNGTPVATDATCGFPFTNNTNCLLSGIYNITGQFKGDRWDWRAVADYRFNEDFMAYASVTTGFKGGGVNPRPFFVTQRLPFNPETLTTYETGFKSDLIERRLRLNGAVFLNKYKDITLGKQNCPESAPFPSQPCLRPSNIGKADVKGAELELTAFATDNLSFDGSASYLHFKYTNSPDANGNLPNTTIPASSITPYTPKLAYSVGAQYTQAIGSASLLYRLDGSYQGKVFTTAENTPWSRVDGRFLANAKVTYSTEKDWKVALEVQNLFDKYYFQSVSDVTTAFGGVTGVPGKPRTFAVSVERKF